MHAKVRTIVKLNVDSNVFRAYAKIWHTFINYIMSIKLYNDDYRTLSKIRNKIFSIKLEDLIDTVKERNSEGISTLFTSIVPLEKFIPEELLAHILTVLKIKESDLI